MSKVADIESGAGLAKSSSAECVSVLQGFHSEVFAAISTSRRTIVALLAFFCIVVCADLYTNLARESEANMKVRVLEASMIKQLMTLRGELSQTLNDLVSQDQEINKMTILIDDLKQQAAELSEQKEELALALAAARQAHQLEVQRLSDAHENEVQRRSMVDGDSYDPDVDDETERTLERRDAPGLEFEPVEGDDSDIERLRADLETVENELEAAIIAKWNAIGQLEICQSGETQTDGPAPLPKKAPHEASVLAGARVSAAEIRKAAQINDLETDDSQLRQNSPPPMPLGPAHDDSDFNGADVDGNEAAS